MPSHANRSRALRAHHVAAPACGQGPSPATMPIVAGDPDSTINRPGTFLDAAHFAALGNHGYPIDDLFMIDAVGMRDAGLGSQPVADACNAYDVVANQTFFQTNPIRPITLLIRRGAMDRHDAYDIALKRGAVAVRGDDVVGSWSVTWERHDTHAFGGFTLEIGRAADGVPRFDARPACGLVDKAAPCPQVHRANSNRSGQFMCYINRSIRFAIDSIRWRWCRHGGANPAS